MNLYLLRHAMAVERTEWKGSDPERPLTEKGRKRMAQSAEGMTSYGMSFDWILTSPFRRAHDTAQIVAKEYKARDKVRLSKSLTPDGDPKTLLRHLALDFRSWESILLVGHEPYLSKLISVLIGGDGIQVDFKKGGLCLLKADSLAYERCAMLEWFVTPKLLKRLR